jgi:hypothetical protein
LSEIRVNEDMLYRVSALPNLEMVGGLVEGHVEEVVREELVALTAVEVVPEGFNFN